MRAPGNAPVGTTYALLTGGERPGDEGVLRIVAPLTAGVFFLAGYLLTGVDPPPPPRGGRQMETISTSFLVPPPAPPPKPEEPVRREPRVVDLSTEPVRVPERDEIQEQPPSPDPRPSRRVYGVRKVYSQGIGSEGSLSDAVVGRLGTTLDTGVDTLTATEQDLRGRVASLASITTPPRFRKQVKPEYTAQMLDNGIEGVVRVRILVDTDGLVKRAEALNDLGYGSAQAAVEACYLMEFEPARDATGPRAVWIVISIRFVRLGG